MCTFHSELYRGRHCAWRTLGCNFIRTAAAAKQWRERQKNGLVFFFFFFTHKIHADKSDDTIKACENTAVWFCHPTSPAIKWERSLEALLSASSYHSVDYRSLWAEQRSQDLPQSRVTQTAFKHQSEGKDFVHNPRTLTGIKNNTAHISTLHWVSTIKTFCQCQSK